MADRALQSAVEEYREFAIVVISTSDLPGRAVDNLATSLFKKLNRIAADDSSLSVRIEDLGRSREESPSWAITAESAGRINRYLLNEFRFPSTGGPRLADYLIWTFRAPLRAAGYLQHTLRENTKAGSSKLKARALVGMLPKIVRLVAQVVSFFYLTPIISLTVVGPLRRWALGLTVLYSLVLASLVVAGTWKLFLPPLVAWVSRLAHQLLSLAGDTELSFALLFPVLATIIFSVGVSIVVAFLGVVRHAVRRADSRMIAAHGLVDFAYLLDPLYSARAIGAFERTLLEAGTTEEIQSLFVICEHGGILLAYEALSGACPGKMDKPVHLLTHKLDLGGLQIGLLATLWLLVEPTDWSRFAKTTPHNVSWHHWVTRPSEEFVVKMNLTPGERVPQVQGASIKASWFKSPYSMLLDRLIALTNEA